MARRDSVTVSMAAESSGVLREMPRVRSVWVLTCAGATSLKAGTSKTSSKVRASGTGVWIIDEGWDFPMVTCQREYLEHSPAPAMRQGQRESVMMKSSFDVGHAVEASINPTTLQQKW